MLARVGNRRLRPAMIDFCRATEALAPKLKVRPISEGQENLLSRVILTARHDYSGDFLSDNMLDAAFHK
jgi:hypothetical protein